MPRVSIVLPNYNYARYLDERIAGLLNQTFRDFELIIIDDASTDESLRVIEPYLAGGRVTLLRRVDNSGKVYASWNEALPTCTGELVLFAGADDAAERPMIEELVKCFDRDPAIEFAHCGFNRIDGEGGIISTQILLQPEANFIVNNLAHDYVAEPGEEWRRLLVTNFIWNASGVLLRTKSVIDAGGFDPEMLIASDWDLYLKLARSKRVAYVAHPLNGFRQLEKSVSRRLQGAQLVSELYQCLVTQLQYIDEGSKEYFRLGFTLIARALQHYVAMNVQTGNNEEVEKLVRIKAKYQEITG